MIPQNQQQVKANSRWTNKVHVYAVHSLRNAGNVKALVTIAIGAKDKPALYISGCKVIQQPSQRAWVALPDRYDEKREAWYPIVRTEDDELKAEINSVVLARWGEHNAG